MSQQETIDTASWNKGVYFYLLLTLLFTLFILPLTGERISTSILLNLVFSLVMLLGVYSLRRNRRMFWIGLLLMMPALIFRWMTYFVESQLAYGIAELSVSVFLFFTFLMIIVDILQEKNISLNTIYGGIVAYLFIALCFSSLYNGIHIFNNNAFLFNGALETIGKSIDTQTFGDFTYYSLITLSTVGYGEITPYSDYARFSSALQGILGQLYLTIFLARLVGMHIAQYQKH
jgi:hypothetical protein